MALQPFGGLVMRIVRVLGFTIFVMFPLILNAQRALGPRSMQGLLQDPQLNQGVAGITSPKRDVILSGIAGLVWGTDVRHLQDMKFIGESDVLGGIKNYRSIKPIGALDGVRVDSMAFGFWNGMLCNAVIDINDPKRYVRLKQKFTNAFGPPAISTQNGIEKVSWQPRLAIVLMQFDSQRAKITIWSEELYQKMAFMYRNKVLSATGDSNGMVSAN